jgi:small subunit ribosomal protein S4
MEKQKAKYTYGLLERQFRKLFDKASSKKGVTGAVLLQIARVAVGQYGVTAWDFRPTRRAARQLVTHRHITVNGMVTNIPSRRLRPGEVIGVKGKSKSLDVIQESVGKARRSAQFPWLEFNPDKTGRRFS